MTKAYTEDSTGLIFRLNDEDFVVETDFLATETLEYFCDYSEYGEYRYSRKLAVEIATKLTKKYLADELDTEQLTYLFSVVTLDNIVKNVIERFDDFRNTLEIDTTMFEMSCGKWL